MNALLLSVICAIPMHVEMKLGEPATTATSFDLPIPRGIVAAQRAKVVTTANDDLMLFIIGATGPTLDRDLARGPVTHVRGRELPRGYAIVLTPRNGALADMSFVDGSLVIGATDAPAAAIKTLAKAPETRAEPAPAPAQRKIVLAPQPLAPTTEAAPAQAAPEATEAPTAIATPAPAAAAPRRSVALAAPIEDHGSNPIRTFLVLTVLIAGAAAAVVYGKKKQRTSRGDIGGIELVSVRALGPKQRLAVVDACGDRLLIATSEHGVQLLSRLDSRAEITPSFSAALQSASEPPPQLRTPKSADIAGLVKLRAARATWTGNLSEALT